jgi:hypothetical protein
MDEVTAALQPLTAELWQRIAADAAAHSRLPTKLGLTWRIGCGKQQSKTVQLPWSVSRQMRLLLPHTPSTGMTAVGNAVRSFGSGGGGAGVSDGTAGGGKGSLLRCWSLPATENDVKQQQQMQAAGLAAQNSDGQQQQHPMHLGQQQQQQQGDVVCKLLLQAFLEVVKSAAAAKQTNGTSSSAGSAGGAWKQRQARSIINEGGSVTAGFNITRLVLAALYAES